MVEVVASEVAVDNANHQQTTTTTESHNDMAGMEGMETPAPVVHDHHGGGGEDSQSHASPPAAFNPDAMDPNMEMGGATPLGAVSEADIYKGTTEIPKADSAEIRIHVMTARGEMSVGVMTFSVRKSDVGMSILTGFFGINFAITLVAGFLKTRRNKSLVPLKVNHD